MKEYLETNPNIDVNQYEYARLLGYPPGYELTERSLELAEWARDWYNKNGKPWIYSKMLTDIDLSDDLLKLDGFKFNSKRLYKNFIKSEIESLFLTAVSAGKELEEKARELWQQEKPDEYFFLEIYGSSVVEHLIAHAGFIFCEWADQNNKAIIPHYSPGYNGWHVSDQIQLLHLLKRMANNKLLDKLDVLDSGMLNPKKSQLAVFGITRNIEKVRNLSNLIPCETCSLVSCQYRRIPYRNSPNQIENVRQLQPRNDSIGGPNSLIKPLLNSEAKYSFSIKAIRKWSDERLSIYKLSDETFIAKFNYEGTTCTNLGKVLNFVYIIKISSAKENYKILSLNCHPAKNDIGYTYMCDFISYGNSLMKSIEEEKPLLGKPIENVFSWERNYNPEGCFCHLDSRQYKWGLIFEVVHYSLMQYEHGRVSIPNMHEENNLT